MRERRFGGRDDRGGRFAPRGFDRPKPVKVGEEYDVHISDVGAKGDGITKIENFIVFVAGAQKGEDVRIRITEVANKFAIGEKVGASEEPSEEQSEEQSEATEAEEPSEASEEAEESEGTEESGAEE